MKNLSFWAKTHPLKARWLIALAHCALFPLAGLLGFLLFLDDFGHSPLTLDVCLTLFLLGVVFYPLKGAKHLLWRHSYRRQKAFDFAVLLSGFLALASFVGLKLAQPIAYQSAGRATHTATLVAGSAKEKAAHWAKKTNWRALRKHAHALKSELRAAEKFGKADGQKALKVVGTIFVLLFAIALMAGVSVLACELSCSGQEGAALLVAVGGFALIVFLAVWAIRGIWKRGKKSSATPATG
jgi:hypothetical protein